MSQPTFDPYQVLGVQPGATRDEIVAAHRELVRRIHPDVGGNTELTRVINHARDLLLQGPMSSRREPEPPPQPTWDIWPDPPPQDETAPDPATTREPKVLPAYSTKQKVGFGLLVTLVAGVFVAVTVAGSLWAAIAFVGLYTGLVGVAIGTATVRETPEWMYLPAMAGYGIGGYVLYMSVQNGRYEVTVAAAPLVLLGVVLARRWYASEALTLGGGALTALRNGERLEPKAWLHRLQAWEIGTAMVVLTLAAWATIIAVEYFVTTVLPAMAVIALVWWVLAALFGGDGLCGAPTRGGNGPPCRNPRGCHLHR